MCCCFNAMFLSLNIIPIACPYTLLSVLPCTNPLGKQEPVSSVCQDARLCQQLHRAALCRPARVHHFGLHAGTSKEVYGSMFGSPAHKQVSFDF